MRNPPLGLLPDFIGGHGIVSFPVGLIGILVGVEVLVGVGLSERASHADRAVGTVPGIRINNVGAVALQDLLALAGDVFGHAERDRESLGSTEHRISNTSIAAGGVEKNLSRTKMSSAAGFGNDVGGGTVFH